MPDYAGVLAFRENHLALVRERYEHWNTEHRNLPAGALEPGESPEDAAIRELREKAGAPRVQNGSRIESRKSSSDF